MAIALQPITTIAMARRENRFEPRLLRQWDYFRWSAGVRHITVGRAGKTNVDAATSIVVGSAQPHRSALRLELLHARGVG